MALCRARVLPAPQLLPTHLVAAHVLKIARHVLQQLVSTCAHALDKHSARGAGRVVVAGVFDGMVAGMVPRAEVLAGWRQSAAGDGWQHEGLAAVAEELVEARVHAGWAVTAVAQLVALMQPAAQHLLTQQHACVLSQVRVGALARAAGRAAHGRTAVAPAHFAAVAQPRTQHFRRAQRVAAVGLAGHVRGGGATAAVDWYRGQTRRARAVVAWHRTAMHKIALGRARQHLPTLATARGYRHCTVRPAAVLLPGQREQVHAPTRTSRNSSRAQLTRLAGADVAGLAAAMSPAGQQLTTATAAGEDGRVLGGESRIGLHLEAGHAAGGLAAVAATGLRHSARLARAHMARHLAAVMAAVQGSPAHGATGRHQ